MTLPQNKSTLDVTSISPCWSLFFGGTLLKYPTSRYSTMVEPGVLDHVGPLLPLGVFPRPRRGLEEFFTLVSLANPGAVNPDGHHKQHTNAPPVLDPSDPWRPVWSQDSTVNRTKGSSSAGGTSFPRTRCQSTLPETIMEVEFTACWVF